MRQVSKQRNTRETKIQLTINLDGSGKVNVRSGIGYLDHMLEQLAFHGLFDLDLQCEGDLGVDCHHTVEDISLTLGAAVLEALGDKQGIVRYGQMYVPMDETLVRTVLDLSGRPDFVFQGEFRQPVIGALDTQMISHFFKSFAIASKTTLHMAILYGENDHHKCEGLFKSFARALRQATELDPRRAGVTSTKGVL
ncbi:MAG: imidazoleglycerol-phosphate dehydratase HisB [SAR324 cluster bacterium]|nr:imidazoleglycerol-phosphate dehydratase HisB [SAR324 cluster bacterium]